MQSEVRKIEKERESERKRMSDEGDQEVCASVCADSAESSRDDVVIQLNQR